MVCPSQNQERENERTWAGVLEEFLVESHECCYYDLELKREKWAYIKRERDDSVTRVEEIEILHETYDYYELKLATSHQ